MHYLTAFNIWSSFDNDTRNKIIDICENILDGQNFIGSYIFGLKEFENCSIDQMALMVILFYNSKTFKYNYAKNFNKLYKRYSKNE